MKEIIKDIKKISHPSGLDIYLLPNSEFSKSYAVYATHYGSVNAFYKTGGEFAEMPDGMAHFLEHKLFENPEGDAFSLFGQYGGNANAFTDFDMTAYLFSCTSNFKENFEILLDFVNRPYFTEKSVVKERGIIEQEIKMYDDSPDWRLIFNLLEAMYEKSPVRKDIAGTAETISRITPELLYEIYGKFYSPENMIIAICGNVSESEVAEIAERVLPKGKKPAPEKYFPPEPSKIRQKEIRQNFAVSMPMFAMGFKDNEVFKEGKEAAKRDYAFAILCEIIAGKASPLYNKLYESGLINDSFSAGYESSYSFAYALFSGESKEPNAVYEKILEECGRLKASGFSEEVFLRAKKKVYGMQIKALNSPERIANAFVRCAFRGFSLSSLLEAFSEIKYEEVLGLLEVFAEENCAFSVILPK